MAQGDVLCYVPAWFPVPVYAVEVGAVVRAQGAGEPVRPRILAVVPCGHGQAVTPLEGRLICLICYEVDSALQIDYA